MCTAVHRKEKKFKETGSSGGLYIILTKERGFGLQRMRNHGEGTMKYMGELMEDQGYVMSILVKFAYPNSSLCQLSVSSDECSSS